MKWRPGRFVLCYFHPVWHKKESECVSIVWEQPLWSLMRRSERRTHGCGQWRKRRLRLRQGHSAFHLGRWRHFRLIWPPSSSAWHLSSCRAERNPKRKSWESNSSRRLFEGLNAAWFLVSRIDPAAVCFYPAVVSFQQSMVTLCFVFVLNKVLCHKICFTNIWLKKHQKFVSFTLLIPTWKKK